MGDQNKGSHMKVKRKISYLGQRNSILPWQMAEQLAVEVDVKNVTYGGGGGAAAAAAGQALLFALDYWEKMYSTYGSHQPEWILCTKWVILLAFLDIYCE